MLHEDNNIFHRTTQNFFGLLKILGLCQEFFGFGLENFIVHEGNIIYPSNEITISGLLNISGVCMEISSMCPEIRILHKDYAIFIQ